jgi:hypothetical protein
MAIELLRIPAGRRRAGQENESCLYVICQDEASDDPYYVRVLLADLRVNDCHCLARYFNRPFRPEGQKGCKHMEAVADYVHQIKAAFSDVDTARAWLLSHAGEETLPEVPPAEPGKPGVALV